MAKLSSMQIDPTASALLVMDCQAGIVSIYTKPEDRFIERLSAVVVAARTVHLPVIHVQVAFRPGLPEVSTHNKLFGVVKASPQHQRLFQGAAGAIHPALGPEPSDLIVTKHRISAFAGTDLAMLLRAMHVNTLILCGIATSGVILSTLVEASDADFHLHVLGDCCADNDPELHTALVIRLFPQRAEVLTADAFLQALPAAPLP